MFFFDWLMIIVFFIGFLKVSTSNSFIMVLICLEMMTMGIFINLLMKIWVESNVHFLIYVFVFSVVEGVVGLSILVSLFSNSSILFSGIWSTKL